MKGTFTMQSSDCIELTYDNQEIKFWLPDRATDHIQRRIFEEKHFYEQEMLCDMQLRIKSDDLVIDVGAYLGNHTVFLAAICGANVIAVEPNPYAITLLEQNIEVNELAGRVTVHRAAAGRSAGYATIVETSPENIGHTRLSPSETGDVAMIRLDDLALSKPLRAIKIDVEGMELDVLEGALGAIRNHLPLIYLESGSQARLSNILDALQPLGYGALAQFNATPTVLFVPVVDGQRLLNAQAALLRLATYRDVTRQGERLTRLTKESSKQMAAVASMEQMLRAEQSIWSRTAQRVDEVGLAMEKGALSRTVVAEHIRNIAAAIEVNQRSLDVKLNAMDAKLSERLDSLSGRFESIEGSQRNAREGLAQARRLLERLEDRGTALTEQYESLTVAQRDLKQLFRTLMTEVRRTSADVFSLKLRADTLRATIIGSLAPPHEVQAKAKKRSGRFRRKLRKLVRDPQGFVRDAKSPAIRKVQQWAWVLTRKDDDKVRRLPASAGQKGTEKSGD